MVLRLMGSLPVWVHLTLLRPRLCRGDVEGVGEKLGFGRLRYGFFRLPPLSHENYKQKKQKRNGYRRA
jgi:hypothetical protein